MKNIFSFIAVLFVALVAFGGWYGGVKYSTVDAEFAPAAIAEMVFEDGTTANIILTEVEITSIAEGVFSPFDSSIRNEYVATPVGLQSMLRDRRMNIYSDPVELLLGNHNRHMAYTRVSARHSGISWTRRYLA